MLDNTSAKKYKCYTSNKCQASDKDGRRKKKIRRVILAPWAASPQVAGSQKLFEVSEHYDLI